MFDLYFPQPRATLPRWIVAIVLSLFALVMVRPVLAQTGHTFRLLPDPLVTQSKNSAYFVYEFQPGTVIADAVLVKNVGTEPIDLVLYPADAMTAAGGGVAIATNVGETPSAAGAWLQLSQTEIRLEADESRSVPFTLTIPEGISPAEYGATIVTQPADSSEIEEQGGPFGIRFIPQTATTILITIPGPEPLQPKLEITALRAETKNGQQIIADLSNTGNDGLKKAEGTLTIRDTTGDLLHEMALRLGYVLAGDTLPYRIGLTKALDAGEYDVTLALIYQDQTVEKTARLSFGAASELPEVNPNDDEGDSIVTPPSPWPDPWLIVAGGIIFLFAALFIIQSRRLARAQRMMDQ